MALQDTITLVVATGAKLKGTPAANEANTKAVLIEPILNALGWTPMDVDVVEREVKVYGGTFLDYALKVAGKARVYVEAKAVGENLEDPKLITQTINYANNDGVVWCVLTNGLRYRVYKANESAVADKKLLFEVDLTTEEALSEKATLLRSLGREAVEAGDLDALGDKAFTDKRVRAALAAVVAHPPAELLALVQSHIAHPSIAEDALKQSLARILGAPGTTPKPPPGAPKKPPVGGPGPPKGQEFSLDHHLGSKSALIQELWEGLDKHGSALGGDVTRRIRKQYIGYYRGKKSFFTAEIQHRKILVSLALDTDTAKPWNDSAMRDVSNIGHFGMGDSEYSLVTPDQLPEVCALISLAYARQ